MSFLDGQARKMATWGQQAKAKVDDLKDTRRQRAARRPRPCGPSAAHRETGTGNDEATIGAIVAEVRSLEQAGTDVLAGAPASAVTTAASSDAPPPPPPMVLPAAGCHSPTIHGAHRSQCVIGGCVSGRGRSRTSDAYGCRISCTSPSSPARSSARPSVRSTIGQPRNSSGKVHRHVDGLEAPAGARSTGCGCRR
ncbi:MAG: hypothetical protein R2713_23410 [Ilumatobacteraceae bacterium]